MMELNGDGVSSLELLETSCARDCSCTIVESSGGKCFGVYHENNHGSKRESGQRVQQLKRQVQVDDQSTLPSSYRSFVAVGDESYAPAEKWCPSERGVTHTY